MNNSLGKLIVIDGTDGSGKSVQTKLLVDRLKAANLPVAEFDFLQYNKASGRLVSEYLNGNFGTAEEVGAYRASVFYACDRYEASKAIKQALAEGKLVITNRYVSSNLAHQGGKISDPLERKAYYDWCLDLEYRIFGIPQPDLNIILHVPAAIAQALVDKKDQREYLDDKKRDIHEDDLNHLLAAERIYLELANSLANTSLIECVTNDEMLDKETIANLVYSHVQSLIA